MNIVVIEDEPLLREAVTEFLNSQEDFNVTAFDSIASFVDQYRMDTRIDLILLDIMLNGQNSLHHLFKIKRLVPDSKILIVTGNKNEAYLLKAIQEGADGYYLKGDSLARLLEAIENIILNNAFVDPGMVRMLFKRFKSSAKSPAQVSPELDFMAQHFDLGKREIEILTGLYEGMRYKEIADRYHVSINTVRHYVLSLYRKTQVNSRKDLLKKVRSLG